MREMNKMQKYSLTTLIVLLISAYALPQSPDSYPYSIDGSAFTGDVLDRINAENSAEPFLSEKITV